MRRTFDDRLRKQRARIAAWLEQRREADVAIAICERWIDDLVAGRQELPSRHDFPALPSELNLLSRLSAAGLGPLAGALAWQIDNREGLEPPEAPLIGHALAVASGHAYAKHGPHKLVWIGHFVSTIDSQAWEDFADSAAQALRQNADWLSEFIDFAADIIKTANDEPERVIQMPPRQASMSSIVQQYARGGGFQEVWETDMWPVLFRHSDVFEIFRRADAERFVKMIDELPHPVLVKQCLSSKALKESPGEVLGLLRLADRAFDTENRWRRDGMASILLLQLASEQLLSAASIPDEESCSAGFYEQTIGTEDPQSAEEAKDLEKGITHYREAAGRLIDILFARPDGAELGWHWLENLLRQAPRLPRPDGRGARKFIINRIGILVQALSGHLAPRRGQNAWIAEAAPFARQYRAVAVLSVAAFSTMADALDVGTVARGLLKDNCFELTGPREVIQLPGAPLRTIPGDALARIPDVASWFADSWSALRFERERAWRRRPSQDGTNPAEIMGLWALGVIETLVTNAESPRGLARATWEAIEPAFREARLVEPRMGKDFWSQAVARFFSWWPSVFVPTQDSGGGRDETAAADPAMLGRTLAPYAGISSDFMAIVMSLREAGLSATTLDCAVRVTGNNLSRMIRRFLETARGLEDRRVWNPKWVAALGAIETSIAAGQSSDRGTSTLS
jgi:hypothetical protein